MRLAPSTSLTIEQVNDDPANPVTRLFFESGKIFVILGNLLGQEGYLDVETPVGVASIRGSLMSLEIRADGLWATCLSGTCLAGNDDGGVAFGDREQVRVNRDEWTEPKPAPEEDLRDWENEFGAELETLLRNEEALKDRSVAATAQFYAAATSAAIDTPDKDRDGWSRESGDCDDDNPKVFPHAPDEPGDGVDSDCDGTDGVKPDEDGDGWSVARGDCNDRDASVYPYAPDKTGDGIDSNCDGNDGTAPDKDGDGRTLAEGDCDDTNAKVFPGAEDRPDDGVDSNCDGVDGNADDRDGDGHSAGKDCDDADARVYPGAPELPDDRKDNDCDGKVDELDASPTPTRVFACLLLKGCASPTPTLEEKKPTETPTPECSPLLSSLRCPPTSTPTKERVEPSKTSTSTEPSKPTSAPTKTQAPIMGGCLLSRCTPTPTTVVKPPTPTYTPKPLPPPTFTPRPPDPTKTSIPSATPVPIVDRDRDGYPDYKDCDDSDPSINPDAREVEDGKDNNCDGKVDEGFDQDGDGYTRLAGDCDDGRKDIRPGAPDDQGDGIDNDCDGQTDEDYDGDGDRYTPAMGDCDDADKHRYPGAPETRLDRIDSNCNGYDNL